MSLFWPWPAFVTFPDTLVIQQGKWATEARFWGVGVWIPVGNRTSTSDWWGKKCPCLHCSREKQDRSISSRKWRHFFECASHMRRGRSVTCLRINRCGGVYSLSRQGRRSQWNTLLCASVRSDRFSLKLQRKEGVSILFYHLVVPLIL